MKTSKSWGLTIVFAALTAILPFANDHLSAYGIHVTEDELNHMLMAFGLTGGIGAAAQVRKSMKPKHVMPTAEELNREAEKVRQAINSRVGGSPEYSSREAPMDDHPQIKRGVARPAESVTIPFGTVTTEGRDWLHAGENKPTPPAGRVYEAAPTQPKPTGIHHPEVIMKHDIHQVKWAGTGFYQTNFHTDGERGNALHYGQAFLWIKIPSAREFLTVQLFDAEGRMLQVDQSHDHDEDNDHTTTRLEMFARSGNPMPRGKYVLTVRADNEKGFKDDEFWIV